MKKKEFQFKFNINIFLQVFFLPIFELSKWITIK